MAADTPIQWREIRKTITARYSDPNYANNFACYRRNDVSIDKRTASILNRRRQSVDRRHRINQLAAEAYQLNSHDQIPPIGERQNGTQH